ncbi:MAG: quercetin dioxygenase-like cupin family protein, partial [Saprospiraceae bacterium]
MKTREQITEKSQAQVLLPSSDLPGDIAFFSTLGFLLHNIFPADDPAVAVMYGHGLQVRLDKNALCPPATINILTDDPLAFGNGQNEHIAPNGTIFKILPKSFRLHTPPSQHKFEVRQLKDSEPWIIGRAGMLYRDLIPDRLGGSIIASHIRIPDGGPVPDMVHYHTIGFQLIFCYKGWVKLVYEDQGPPFILHAGDCVTQPPEIRHRVLESSDNLEVIE